MSRVEVGTSVASAGSWAHWSRRKLKLRLVYKCLTRCAPLQLRIVDLRGRTLAHKRVVLAVPKTKHGAVMVELPWSRRRQLSLSRAEMLILRGVSLWRGRSQEQRLRVGYLLDGPKLSLLGQRQWYAGSVASFRVVVSRRRSGKPYKGARVKVTMAGPRGVLLRQGCVADGAGICPLRFQVKESWLGWKVKLRFVASSDMGKRTLQKTVSIHRQVRALLTSDKAIYQPGQRIYLRLLAMKMPTGRVLSGAKVRLIVKDGQGNRVFAKVTNTNDFGIAHGVFALARQVNQGSYLLMARVITPGGQTISSTKRVKVYKYRLPTFQVQIKPRRRFFLLSDVVAGKVFAKYLFGKVVTNANVKLDAWLQGFQSYRLFSFSGKTDATGYARFQMKLSLSDVMMAQRRYGVDHQRLHISATVTAPGGEIQRGKTTVPLATFPLEIKVIPEFSSLIMGLRQKLYVMSSLPDGSPVPASVKLRLGRAKGAVKILQVTTDEHGLGVVWIKPWGKQKLPLLATAKDKQGRKGRFSSFLWVQPPQRRRSAIVRPAYALYRGGDTVSLDVFAGPGADAAGVDVFVGEQLCESHSVRLKDGKGTLSLRLKPSVYGLVRFVAYRMGSDDGREYPRWGVGWIYVQRAGDIQLKVTMDRAIYRPKQTARITFSARDEKARPVQAALGVQLVDRAVLALSGAPGQTLRTYFRLQRAALASGVKIPGFGPKQLVFGAWKGKAWAHRRRAAAILLAASTPRVLYGQSGNSEHLYLRGLGRRAARLGRYAVRAIARRLARHAWRYLYRLQKKSRCGLSEPHVDLSILQKHTGLKPAQTLDPWGQVVRFQLDEKRKGHYLVKVTSVGLNGSYDGYTRIIDDITVQIPLRLKPRKVSSLCFARMGRLGSYGIGYGAGGGYGGYRGSGLGGIVRGASSGPLNSDWTPGVVRHFFPELLFQHPSLITDRDGKAHISVKMADSITTWQLLTLASTKDGRFGVHRASIRVSQPFFVSLRAPQALQRGDQVTLPVLLHNHRPTADSIAVTLQREPWFRLVASSARQRVAVAPHEVKLVKFIVQVLKAGDRFWRIRAQGRGVSDALVQPVSVDPGGRPLMGISAGYLRGVIKREIELPREALPGSGQLSLEIAPGPVAEQLGGLDSMLREPHGCFEQTSSSLYPNVMILKHYRTRKRPPQAARRAQGMVAKGYQRLLSFEVERSGGFSLYGRAPASPMLTAYGLHEFTDMAEVYDVSPTLLRRIQGYLSRTQHKDGAWTPKSPFQSGRFQRKLRRLRHTAYVAWALGRVPAKQRHRSHKGTLSRAIAYLKSQLSMAKDAYTLAMIGQAAAHSRGQGRLLRRIMRRLVALQQTKGETVFWRLRGGSLTGARGRVSTVETTALVVSLLLQKGQYLKQVRRGLGFLMKHRSPRGGWGTTQATIQVLQTLLLAQRKNSVDARGVVSVDANGATVKRLALTADNADVFHKIDLSHQLRLHHKAKITFRFRGKGRPTFQLRHRYRMPLGVTGKTPRHKLLQLKVSYPTKTIAGKWHRVRLEVENVGLRAAHQPIVKIGHPAGFSIRESVLEGWVKGHQIERYERTDRHLVLYLKTLPPTQRLQLSYPIRAAHPQIVSPSLSSLYEYYQPQRMTYASGPSIATE